VVNLSPTRFDNAQTFYAPSVAVGAVTLLPARFDNVNRFYSPVISTGSAILAPDRFDNTNTFYGPTAVRGTITLTPDRLDNTNQFYGAFVSSGSTQEITFPDWVEPGHVEPGWVSWPYFNANQFFSPTVERIDPPVHRVEITDYEPKLWWLRKPKAVTEEEAKEKVETVAKTIEKVVKAKKVGEAPTKKEIKQAVAPLVQAMPGFDWVKLYEQILIQIQIVESNKRFQAEQARILMDEDDAEILLLLA
jgi:hypothetical protein